MTFNQLKLLRLIQITQLYLKCFVGEELKFLLVVEGAVGGVQVKQVEPTGLLRAGLDFVLQDGVVP